MSRVLFRPLLSRSFARRGLRFTTSTASLPPPPTPPPSLSQRLKALSKEYGYSALGVYLALSALDFPFCFLAVRHLGAERVGRWEDTAVAFAKPYWTGLRHAVGFPPPPPSLDKKPARDEHEHDGTRAVDKDAEKSASTSYLPIYPPSTPHPNRAIAEYVVLLLLFAAGVWTELALAYAVHKSFIFIRVPLTAAVTPKVVKVLRGWGWDIGKKGKPKISMPPPSV